MARLKLNAWHSEHEITIDIDNYANNGNLYIGLVCWDEEFPEPWSDLTVNFDIKCEPNKAFVDTNNNGSDIERWIVMNKLGMPTGRVCTSGFCTYPEYEFNIDELKKYMEEI